MNKLKDTRKKHLKPNQIIETKNKQDYTYVYVKLNIKKNEKVNVKVLLI